MEFSTHRFSTPLQTSLVFCLGILLTACGGGGSNASSTQPEQVLSGRTSFVSVDSGSVGSTLAFDGTLKATTAAPALVSATGETATRSVQEGDIYRVLDGGKTILSLNRYRGLQVIDISNTASPRIIGRAAMSGDPVEMYRVGERVYVLLNNWAEYRRVSKGGKESLEQFTGGGVVTVDISDLSAPKILGTTRVAGYIQTSRLTSGAGKSALYVTASDNAFLAVAVGSGMPVNDENKTKVLSYGISEQGLLESKSTLALGGFVQAVQASGERLMVARANESGGQTGSRVAVIDISSPDGVMVQGADVQVSGLVQKKTNMHIHGNVMRIVSGNWWSSDRNVNHVESFNIADIAHPAPVDHDTFGAGQQLFGTTFFADKAFFVTYLRQDPFHAFSIAPDGTMKEESEFVVSGWNDFFVPVQNETRLVGVGHNDENSRRSLSISLYDVSNLQNTKPLLMRADIDLSDSWSEATWDDRAFTVLENATSAVAADGKTRETGLVLLPFTGWSPSAQEYVGGVQIFTFSATTITRRGTMMQDTVVRRSFMGDAANNLATNLSDSELSLFNIENTDAPQASGKVQLAPSFSQFLAFRNVGVRYHNSDTSWWGQNGASRRTDLIELVSLANADGATALASFSVPASSRIYNVADKLVVVSSETIADGISTTVATYDLADSANPVRMGSLTTNELVQSGYQMRDAIVCGFAGSCWGGFSTPEATPVGNALVFAGQTAHVKTTSAAVYGRYWSSYTFHVLDLGNPAKPVLLPKISMAEGDEATGLIKDGNTAWINYKKPEPEGAAGQPQAKYFIKALDLSNASTPKLGAEINVPGQLMAVTGDVIYTVDHSWSAKEVDTSLNMLIVRDNLAYLQASHPLAGQSPQSMIIDGKNVIVAHYDTVMGKYAMSIFEVANKQFNQKSTVDFSFYPVLREAGPGKVLVQAGYGFLLYDVSQAQPFAQAFFPATSWGGNVSVAGKDIYVPASAYGIYQFNIDTVNLSKP